MTNPWIKNTGVRPVGATTLVDVKFFNGIESLAGEAELWAWENSENRGFQIEYYRLTKVDNDVVYHKKSFGSKYWMVHGNGPTNHRHSTKQSAIEEANRLAKQHPNTYFTVLQGVHWVRASQTTIMECQNID